ncbi:MAG: hypothetical protein ACRCU2_26500 [Planktothrix sp.]
MRGELDKAKLGIIDRDVAIAKLENQLSGTVAELERVNGKLEAIKVGSNTGIMNQAELIKFIKGNYSDSDDINESVLAHAAETGEFLKLTKWGRKYGFRFLGKLVNDYGYEIVGDGGAIATLQTELDKIKAKLEDRDMAIANLKTELEARGGIKQLSLFPPEPTPEPELETEPEPIPTPEPKPTQKTPAGTLSRGELVQHILEKFPGSKINGQNITDAINGKSKNLPKFEGEYGFKFIGKIKGENRFKLL